MSIIGVEIEQIIEDWVGSDGQPDKDLRVWMTEFGMEFGRACQGIVLGYAAGNSADRPSVRYGEARKRFLRLAAMAALMAENIDLWQKRDDDARRERSGFQGPGYLEQTGYI